MNSGSSQKLTCVESSKTLGQQTCEGCKSGNNDIIYTTEPMPFIQSIASGKLIVNPKTRDLLSRIEKPLVVISIAGLYRTGIYLHNISISLFKPLDLVCLVFKPFYISFGYE